MLRLTNLKLPLEHTPDALPAAICARLGIPRDALRKFTVFRRGYDAQARRDRADRAGPAWTHPGGVRGPLRDRLRRCMGAGDPRGLRRKHCRVVVDDGFSQSLQTLHPYP